MTVKEKLFLYASLFLCSATGVSMFLIEFFLETTDDFGIREHWLLDDAKMFHYIFTPLLIVSFGLLWQGHISKGLKNKRRAKRVSGLFILTTMITLVFTGQSLLFLISESSRYWVAWAHITAGALITLGIVKHALKSRRTAINNA